MLYEKIISDSSLERLHDKGYSNVYTKIKLFSLKNASSSLQELGDFKKSLVYSHEAISLLHAVKEKNIQSSFAERTVDGHLFGLWKSVAISSEHVDDPVLFAISLSKILSYENVSDCYKNDQKIALLLSRGLQVLHIAWATIFVAAAIARMAVCGSYSFVEIC